MTRCDDNEKVYIGTEDGVSVYANRESLTGIDVVMMRDRRKRELAEKSQRGMHEWAKENPALAEKIIRARMEGGASK